MLRSATSALLAQGALHAELVQIEWAEEKGRLWHMLVTLLVGGLCLLCALFSLSALVLIYSWETSYRNLVLVGLVLFYCSGALVAWRRFQVLSARGGHAFADTRTELAADIALIRSTLDAQK